MKKKERMHKIESQQKENESKMKVRKWKCWKLPPTELILPFGAKKAVWNSKHEAETACLRVRFFQSRRSLVSKICEVWDALHFYFDSRRSAHFFAVRCFDPMLSRNFQNTRFTLMIQNCIAALLLLLIRRILTFHVSIQESCKTETMTWSQAPRQRPRQSADVEPVWSLEWQWRSSVLYQRY